MMPVVLARALFLPVVLAAITATTIDQQALNDRIIALNKQALDEIERKEFAPARKHLLEAVRLAKKGGEHNPMFARTFIDLGALTIIEGGPRQGAIDSFKRALEIAPEVGVTPALATGEVMQVFREVRVVPICPDGVAPRCPWKEDAGDPALPANVEALDCPIREVVQEGKPLVFRCAANPRLKIERVTVYYGKYAWQGKFKARAMRKNARGWWTVTLPADQVSPKQGAYYVVARDAADRAVASHGSADNPDFVLVSQPQACSCEPETPPQDKPVPPRARPSNSAAMR